MQIAWLQKMVRESHAPAEHCLAVIFERYPTWILVTVTPFFQVWLSISSFMLSLALSLSISSSTMASVPTIPAGGSPFTLGNILHWPSKSIVSSTGWTRMASKALKEERLVRFRKAVTKKIVKSYISSNLNVSSNKASEMEDENNFFNAIASWSNSSLQLQSWMCTNNVHTMFALMHSETTNGSNVTSLLLCAKWVTTFVCGIPSRSVQFVWYLLQQGNISGWVPELEHFVGTPHLKYFTYLRRLPQKVFRIIPLFSTAS